MITSNSSHICVCVCLCNAEWGVRAFRSRSSYFQPGWAASGVGYSRTHSWKRQGAHTQFLSIITVGWYLSLTTYWTSESLKGLLVFHSADKQKVAPSKSHIPASTSRNQSTTVRSSPTSISFSSCSGMFHNPPNVFTSWSTMSRY